VPSERPLRVVWNFAEWRKTPPKGGERRSGENAVQWPNPVRRRSRAEVIRENSVRAMFSPDFCEKRCPICTRARKGNRIARFLQAIEVVVTFGGCPWGRARQRMYGVRPSEPLPPGQQATAKR
jgi:hypothetical protein